MGVSRHESWAGHPFLSPGDLPHPGMEPGSPTLQADSLPSELPGSPSLSIVFYIILTILMFHILKKEENQQGWRERPKLEEK